jgi:hypothetical protein
MTKVIGPLIAALALAAGSSYGREGEVPPSGFGRLDHVFPIIMENGTNTDILGNANAPFAYAGMREQCSWRCLPPTRETCHSAVRAAAR